jgi:hypothetical protein
MVKLFPGISRLARDPYNVQQGSKQNCLGAILDALDCSLEHVHSFWIYRVVRNDMKLEQLGFIMKYN